MRKIYCQACKQYYEIEDHLSASSYTCMKCQGPLVDAPANVPLATPTGAPCLPGGGFGVQPSSKSRLAYCILGIFLGVLGVHNFYSGHAKRGLIKLILTVLLCWTIIVPLGIFIWTLVEIVTVNSDSEGRPFDSQFGCLGIGAILLVIVFFMTVPMAVLAGMLLPALAQAREKARQVNCANNLKQICLAYVMYCDDYNMPPSEYAQLLPYTGNHPQLFRCPSLPTDDIRPAYRMIVYPIAHNEMTRPSTTPIIIERLGNHKKSITVGYVDGHVETKFVQADSYHALMPQFPDVDDRARSALEQQLQHCDNSPDW